MAVEYTGAKVVKCRLRQLMGAHDNMRISELAEQTGLQRNSISAMYNNTATRYDAKSIAAICTALDCDVGDLLVLEEAKKEDPNAV
ncbi:MAG: helix-turn-helix transcriptional regulator [Clostridia bacterium]|nr:helix-turn-helix transcriptional regulator [Clostridia bacterium]MBQ6121526.1 helix-turn-helix transcriptional regulator [Clostridia bacterium]